MTWNALTESVANRIIEITPNKNYDKLMRYQEFIDFKKSTSLFEYAQILNEHFTYQDKVDFIFCIFELAYVDKELHFMEQHLIKKIADILNVEHQDLIKTKLEIQKFL